MNEATEIAVKLEQSIDSVTGEGPYTNWDEASSAIARLVSLAERGERLSPLVEVLRRIEGNIHGAGAERYAAGLAREALAGLERNGD